ncbi:MAG: 2Fe-2S iron-sulfur cluster-binding protein [Bacteroidetes bacterium]|nr:2Fe-2S iron-sulfur cluster-binding protein [Bacteroidota bacterium]
MHTVAITIDDRKLLVDSNQTIIEACATNGISIPHFCWHPKLSVSGNCRMCLVEVEKIPKLAIACMTNVAEGMVVKTKNERVLNAREAVMEFILINHPLDCPICDEAGECKLQDYAYSHSSGFSRFVEDKVHKPKRVKLGPHVMFDAERCILCSRCIRFCDEVAGKHQLQFVDRGDKTTIVTFPGEELDNPYSLNVVDICPVGALTNNEFRFKSRVWEMSFTDSVCTACSRGCNIEVGVRNNEVLRLTPRLNENVNSFWMCDNGRLNSFKNVNSISRIDFPLIKNNNQQTQLSWDEAIKNVVDNLKLFKKNEVAILISSEATNEENYLMHKFAKSVFPENIFAFKHIDSNDQDEVLIRGDKTPNKLGVELLGIEFDDFENLIEKINSNQIKAVYSLDDSFQNSDEVYNTFSKLNFFAIHSNTISKFTEIANVTLSSSTMFEKNGTIINFKGYLQKLTPSIATKEMNRTLDGFQLSRLDKFAAWNDKWGSGPQKNSRPSWKIVMDIANNFGMKLKFQSSEDVFNEMAQKFPHLNGISYLKIGKIGLQIDLEKTNSKVEAI